jgi:hypothetical protein
LISSHAPASIFSLGRTTHKRVSSEHRAVDCNKEEVWWPHDCSYMEVRHLCAAQHHVHAHMRLLQEACSHSPSYIFHSSQSRVSITQDCSGSCYLLTRPLPNTPSRLRCAYTRLARRRPRFNTSHPLRAPRRPSYLRLRPSTVPALAEGHLRANGNARDDMPELPRKASKFRSVPLHAPHAPSPIPAGALSQTGSGTTILYIAATRVLNLPAQPSGSSSRLSSSESVLSAV